MEDHLTKAIHNKSNDVVQLAKKKEDLLRTEGLDTADTMARLRRDILHCGAGVSKDVKEGFRSEGMGFAALVKDEELVDYFRDFDVDVGCLGCHRCSS